jgi:hypothetical protein
MDKPAPAEAGDLIELAAPAGCDEANHGTARYRVDNNGRVKVPREAAFWLISKGGFSPVSPTPPASDTAPKKDGDGARASAPAMPGPAPAKAGGKSPPSAAQE